MSLAVMAASANDLTAETVVESVCSAEAFASGFVSSSSDCGAIRTAGQSAGSSESLSGGGSDLMTSTMSCLEYFVNSCE